MKRVPLLALSVLLGLCGAASPLAAQDGSRTFYDRLPLDTPEHAARAFVDAYAASDYWTVYLILSRPAQDAFVQAVDTIDLGPLIGTAPIDADTRRRFFPIPSRWESTDIGWLFDHVMLVARDTDRLPVRIAPGASIGPVQGTPPHVVVTTAAGPVTLELVRSPAGRWRVQSAIAAGRSADHLPWGLP